MGNIMTFILVAGAWIGIIWYAKSTSIKYKKIIGDNQITQKPTCKVSSDESLFKDYDYYYHDPINRNFAGNIWNND